MATKLLLVTARLGLSKNVHLNHVTLVFPIWLRTRLIVCIKLWVSGKITNTDKVVIREK